ncbi:MAG: putative Na+/H+ antiporter [Acidobacteriota bacterium]
MPPRRLAIVLCLALALGATGTAFSATAEVTVHGAAPAAAAAAHQFPRPLDQYTGEAGLSLFEVLRQRAREEPLNLVATLLFALALLHTFLAPQFLRLSHRVQRRHAERERAAGREPQPSTAAELLHFLGEIEAVFGVWAVPLLLAITLAEGWHTTETFIGRRVNFTEAVFVVVIMAIASTRPVLQTAEGALGALARLGRSTPFAWWVAILTVGPLLGSFITEPAAMIICALLLSRQLFDLGPSHRLRYATLGLLFVNVSVGGTLTHFAAPPVLMVARPWGWDMAFMFETFGIRAALGIGLSTGLYAWMFRREFRELGRRASAAKGAAASVEPIPAWITIVHLLFLAWTVLTVHTPALFIGGFLFFLAFTQATARHQSPLQLRAPLLVGFFLGGLVIHGTMQQWWIAPLLDRLTATPLMLGATLLTAFNDNAAITYLASLVPDLGARAKYAVVAGAVTGGGMTVIANAPNPAGQAVLARHFPDGVSPLGLALGAVVPTIIVGCCFMLL